MKDYIEYFKWFVSLNNGETFFEFKSKIPTWQELLRYIENNNLYITSLGLYTDKGQRYMLPSSSNKTANYSVFVDEFTKVTKTKKLYKDRYKDYFQEFIEHKNISKNEKYETFKPLLFSYLLNKLPKKIEDEEGKKVYPELTEEQKNYKEFYDVLFWFVEEKNRTEPRFIEFVNRQLPIAYNMKRKGTAEVAITTGKLLPSELYTIIEAEYESYKLQLWADEINKVSVWTAVVPK